MCEQFHLPGTVPQTVLMVWQEFQGNSMEKWSFSASKPSHSQLFRSPQPSSPAASLENSQPVPVRRAFLGSAVAKVKGREEKAELEEEEEEEKRHFQASGIFQAPKAPELCPNPPVHPSLTPWGCPGGSASAPSPSRWNSLWMTKLWAGSSCPSSLGDSQGSTSRQNALLGDWEGGEVG